MKKFMKCSGIVLGGLLGLVLLAGLALYAIGLQKLTRTYPDIPVETISIPSDSNAIARGRHIAIIWACTKCHGEDLSGGLVTDYYSILATIPASNLTSGEGGIARNYTDTDWIRAIRHGVKPDSQVEVFMYDYSTLSDEDLGALIAYLKQIPPVHSTQPSMRFGPILPIVPALGFLTPAAERIDHSMPRPADAIPGATVEYGRYLSVLCTECHSTSLASKLEEWSQEEFIRGIQTNVLPDGTQIGPTMSLKTFTEMNDTELTALWLYYQSLQSTTSP